MLTGAARGAGLKSEREILEAIHRPHVRQDEAFFRLAPIAGIVHRANFQTRFPWPEHPSGFIEIKTNNLGFRRDHPTAEGKPAGLFRVLVAGDSHTDGQVLNAESFSTILEDRLNQRAGSPAFEVLNAGVCHHSFRNYLGVVKLYHYLKPDAVVVAVYPGNDFVEAAQFIELRDGLRHDASYMPRLILAEKLDEGAVWQGLNQAAYFKSAPEMKDRVLALALRTLSQIRDIGLPDGAPLLVVLLPNKIDTERETDARRLELTRRFLNLSNDDLRVTAELTAGLGKRLRKAGIAYVDLTRPPPGTELLFWNQDYHLNVNGHRWVAKELLKTELFARR